MRCCSHRRSIIIGDKCAGAVLLCQSRTPKQPHERLVIESKVCAVLPLGINGITIIIIIISGSVATGNTYEVGPERLIHFSGPVQPPPAPARPPVLWEKCDFTIGSIGSIAVSLDISQSSLTLLSTPREAQLGIKENGCASPWPPEIHRQMGSIPEGAHTNLPAIPEPIIINYSYTTSTTGQACTHISGTRRDCYRKRA